MLVDPLLHPRTSLHLVSFFPCLWENKVEKERAEREKCSKMASITTSRPSAFFPSRLSRPNLPPLPYHGLRRAPQEPPSLSVIQSKNSGLGLADPWRRRWRRRGPKKREAMLEDASGHEVKRDLEEEVFEFMEMSENPSFFPTREELIAAGRKDLADAIAVEGRWLAYGWNMEEEGVDGGYLDSSMKESLQEDEILCQQQFSSKANGGGLPCSKEFSMASSFGKSMETEVGEDGGIKGILSKLEIERRLIFGMDSRKKEVIDRGSFDPGDTILLGHGRTVDGNEMATKPGGVHSRNGKSTDVDGIRSSKPVAWKSCISLLMLGKFKRLRFYWLDPLMDGQIREGWNNQVQASFLCTSNCILAVTRSSSLLMVFGKLTQCTLLCMIMVTRTTSLSSLETCFPAC